jgi:Ca2+-binding RTX toxin-like protein
MAGGVSYDNFNQSKELDLYDAETGEGSLTEKWLESRGQMLKEVLKANTNNTSISTHSGKGNYSYQDFMSSSTSISLTSNSTEPLNNSDSPLAEATHKITFAGSTGQNFSGSMESDSLFGGSGADNIDGLGGDDYLEGGQGDDLVDGGADKDTLWGMSGNDILRGNTGDDTLVGGIGKDQLEGGADSDWLQGDKGNDTLEGGKGCDWLEGGADNDTYLFFAGDGNDTIVDTEGENLLKVKGDSNIIATRKGDYVGVYEDEKKNLFIKDGGSLWVIPHGDNGSIDIQSWSESNNFGITLKESDDTNTSGSDGSGTGSGTGDNGNSTGVVEPTGLSIDEQLLQAIDIELNPPAKRHS